MYSEETVKLFNDMVEMNEARVNRFVEHINKEFYNKNVMCIRLESALRNLIEQPNSAMYNDLRDTAKIVLADFRNEQQQIADDRIREYMKLNPTAFKIDPPSAAECFLGMDEAKGKDVTRYNLVNVGPTVIVREVAQEQLVNIIPTDSMFDEVQSQSRFNRVVDEAVNAATNGNGEY